MRTRRISKMHTAPENAKNAKNAKVAGYLSSISKIVSDLFVTGGIPKVLIRDIMANRAKPRYRAPIPPSPGRAVNPLSRTC